jgi:hypothetical protein
MSASEITPVVSQTFKQILVNVKTIDHNKKTLLQIVKSAAVTTQRSANTSCEDVPILILTEIYALPCGLEDVGTNSTLPSRP